MDGDIVRLYRNCFTISRGMRAVSSGIGLDFILDFDLATTERLEPDGFFLLCCGDEIVIEFVQEEILLL